MFVLPIDEEIDLKKAAKVSGEKRLELIPVKDVNRVTGYIRGGCTPVGMKKKYPTYIHESASLFEKIIISGGRIGEQLFINPDDLLKAADAVYADIIK